MAKIETLVDDFDDNSINPTLWPDNFGVVAETGGRARVDCDAGEVYGWQSDNTWDLEDSNFLVEVPVIPDGTGASEAIFAVRFNHPTTNRTRLGFEFDAVNNKLVTVNEQGDAAEFQTGFENGVVWDTTVGSPTISTDRPNLGANSLKINPSAATAYIQHECDPSNVSPWGIRGFFNFESFPSSGNITIFQWTDSLGGEEIGIRVNSSGQLQASHNGSLIGSASSAVSLDTWHTLEIIINDLTEGVEARLNGSTLGSVAASQIGENSNTLLAGSIDASSGMELYIDDIEVNRDQVFDFNPREEIDYSATDHRWVRVTESGDSLTFDTSPDGSTWTTRRTITGTPSWVEAATTAFLSFETSRIGGTDDFAEFDNVNNSVPVSTVETTVGLLLAKIAATASAQHNVDAGILANLVLSDIAATTSADHNVDGSIPLILSFTPETSVDNEVQAVFPFLLDFTPQTARDVVVVTAFPLTITISPETKLDPVVLGSFPLILTFDPETDAPVIVSASIALSLLFDPESQFAPIIGDLNARIQAMLDDSRDVSPQINSPWVVAPSLEHPTSVSEMVE